MEGKKISFGFKKVQRPGDSRLPTLSKPDPEEKRDLIECVEDSTIKVVGGMPMEDKLPLVIPMKPNTISIDRQQQIAEEVEASVEERTEEIQKYVKVEVKLENETLEQQAARELLEDARNIKTEETKVLALPLPKEPPLEGQKESSLEDYENIPIADFGMAMLRGMGWTPGKASKYAQPVLRPKGLGLGADKLVKLNSAKKSAEKQNETEHLNLKKGCYVRVLAGKHSGAYGKVLSLNEEGARVTVEMTLGNNQVELGEQVVQAVTKEEFNERSRVLNSEKYDEYKKKEQSCENSSSSKNYPKASRRYEERESRCDRKEKKQGKREEDMQIHKEDTRECKGNYQINSSEKYNTEYKSETSRRPRRDSSSIERDRSRERSYKNSHRNSSEEDEGRTAKRQDSYKSKKRQSSLESLSSDSSNAGKRKKIKKKRDNVRSKKRDTDKKRKGKKKKRDRDRSPNYKKHNR